MSAHLSRRIALVAGGAAIVGLGTLTVGCSSSTKEAPTGTTTVTQTSSMPSASSSVAVTPTEKGAVTQPLVPSVEDRGGMDSAPCGPGKTKVNGVCQ